MRDQRGKLARPKGSQRKSAGIQAPAAGAEASADNVSSNAVLATDRRGAITEWNKAAERLFGYTASEAVGKSIRIIVPAARQVEQDDLTARAEHGETIDRFETIFSRRDGTLVPIAVTVTALREPAGDIVGVSRIACDLSGRRRIEPG